MPRVQRVTIDDLRRDVPAMLRAEGRWCSCCLRYVEELVLQDHYYTLTCRECTRYFPKPTAVLTPEQVAEALEEVRCLNCFGETEEWSVLEEVYTGEHLLCCPRCVEDAPIVEDEEDWDGQAHEA